VLPARLKPLDRNFVRRDGARGTQTMRSVAAPKVLSNWNRGGTVRAADQMLYAILE